MGLSKKHIIICGQSGVGKTTAAEYLEHFYAYERYHMIGFYKEFLSFVMGLPQETFDNADLKRSVKVPHDPQHRTLQQYMVDGFYAYRSFDPAFSSRALRVAYADGVFSFPTIFEAVRSMEEVNTLNELLNPDHTIKAIITRESEFEGADDFITQVNEGLMFPEVRIVNDGTLASFYCVLDNLATGDF